MCAFKSQEDFEASVYDAVCAPEGYRCADGREFSVLDSSYDAECLDDISEKDREETMAACLKHIDKLCNAGYYDNTDYAAILDGHI